MLEPLTPNIKVRGTHTSGLHSVADIRTTCCTVIIAVIIRETNENFCDEYRRYRQKAMAHGYGIYILIMGMHPC